MDTITTFICIFAAIDRDLPPDEQLPPSPELDQLRQAVLRAEADVPATWWLPHLGWEIL